MKVGFINGGLSLSETFIYDLIKQLSTYHKVVFFTAKEPAYTQGIQYVKLDFLLSTKTKNFIQRLFPKRSEMILAQLEQLKVDRKLNNYVHGLDVVYIDYGTTAVSLMKLLKRVHKPFIVHFHGFDITSKLKDKYYRTSLKWVFQHAYRVLAASDYVKRLLILEGCDEMKIKVVRYGLNKPALDKCLKSVKANDHELNLVFAGRLTPKKHPIALIHAFNIVQQTYSSAYLNIIGDGPLRKECEQLAQILGIQSKIRFYGSLKNEETICQIAKSDIYVQHSVSAISGDQEGFGVSIAEAAYLKKPIVATWHNGIPEHVVDEETGYLVPEFNYQMMAEKICVLLENKSLRNIMGLAGHNRISNMCDSDKRANEINTIIQTLNC